MIILYPLSEREHQRNAACHLSTVCPVYSIDIETESAVKCWYDADVIIHRFC